MTVFPLPFRHGTVRAVRLCPFTDHHDTPVREQTLFLFRGTLPETEGNVFLIDSPQNGTCTVVAVFAPDFVRPVLKIADGEGSVDSGGYPVEVTVCARNGGEKALRARLRALHKRSTLITMSNTWGDGNGRDRVEEAFVKREIDASARLGLDAMQIDDGWQTLFPPSCPRDEKNRRCFLDPFWEPNKDRFPKGMKQIADYTRAKGLIPALWFAPDSGNDFARKERDLSVLKNAYEWGFRLFKLDMLSVLSDENCACFLDYLDRIRAFGEDVDVELDVTYGKRLGFLCGAQHGIVFVENRYAKTPNYYPHCTLRNLWSLARYLPACRLQLEIANPDLYPDRYADDPFAPEGYPMDYLFATVMVCNPLFWMETQFLGEQRTDELSRLFPVWKQHRNALATADVVPIGDRPDGTAHPGFCAETNDGAYLILFREPLAAEEATFGLPVSLCEPQILAQNGNATVRIEGKTAHVTFPTARSYVFVKAKKQM